MTTMEISFRYEGALSQQQILALARVPDVYGIRALRVEEAANEIGIEYDATRMDAARVRNLLRGCGIPVVGEA